MLIDRNGRPLHEWRIDETKLFSESPDLEPKQYLHGTHLLSNGDVVFNVEPRGTVRTDDCRRLQWRTPLGTHHPVAQAGDGSFWVSDISLSPQASIENFPEGYLELDEPTYLDRLAHLSEEGELLNNINVLDILYANEL